jgi:hypothetical protein
VATLTTSDARRRAAAWLHDHARQAHELAEALLRPEVNVGDHRRFYLARDVDVSGVSGTGRVADGVLWPDGTASVRWRGDDQSTVHWDHMASAERVHGHGGATRIVWLDDEQETSS